MIRAIAVAAVVLALLPACGAPGCGGCAEPLPSVEIFAAASLKLPFDAVGKRLYERQRIVADFVYAGTQTLTSQLRQGAQADVFASADTEHMTTANKSGLIDGTPQIFAHNRLEIVVQRGNPKFIRSLSDLGRAGLVVVLADPSVPAGKYAQQALAKAHVIVEPASLELQVTGVLNKVALGEADAGIVYVSDIVTRIRVDGVAIPDNLNVVADYPIAVLKSAKNKLGATAFVSLVLSSEGQGILQSSGFQGV